jgi:hypothetical protein
VTDLLERGAAWLEEQRRAHMTRTVTYQRGAQSVEVAATVGKTVFRLDTGYGVVERHETRDYLVLAEELVLDGQTTLPKAGDRVRETEPHMLFIYEVMAPGNEPCWRYSDPYRRALRIHTKLVHAETIP